MAESTLLGLTHRTDDRSFVQRFGKKCPFCGKRWSDPGRCGPMQEGDWTIEKALSSLFAGRDKKCAICDKSILISRQYCNDCAAAREKSRNAQDRHATVTATCEECGTDYERRADKKKQKYCSLSCGNKARHR